MIEETIKKANDYFVLQLMNRNFEVIKIDQYSVYVKIDNKYNFALWISNGVQYFASQSSSTIIITMNLTFTDAEAENLHTYLNSEFKKVERESIIETINQAQEKLENLTD